jgi:serine/threonine protein kinase
MASIRNKSREKGTMKCLKRERGCICCKKAYNGRRPVAVIDHHIQEVEGSLSDKGFYELLSQFQHHQINPATTSKQLEPSMAKQVASYARRRARQVSTWQNPAERQAQKPLMAPFELKEIEIGRLLGVGGFSYVFEIQAFDTEADSANTSTSTMSSSSSRSDRRRSSSSSMSLGHDKDQKKAREFLAQHAIRPQEDEIDTKEVSSGGDSETLKPNHLTRYAIKHLRPTLLQTPDVFAKAAMDLSCEAEMMLCLNHPNIVKLRGWGAGGPGAYKEGRHNSYFLIVDRLLETLEDRTCEWRRQWKNERSCTMHSSIVSRFQGRKKSASETSSASTDALLVERIKVAYEMSCALEYLHEKRIVYRDLKSANAGFDIRGDVKLFDFGLSRYLPVSTGDVEETFRMSNVGTRRYTAPEVTAKKPYNLKADVYSFGVTLWEILMMSTPTKVTKPKYAGETPPARKPLVPCSCWPPALQRLVSSMLSQESADRPTMTHARMILKEVLVNLSDPNLSAQLLVDEGTSRRRRSTYRLECCDLTGLGLKDLEDDDLNLQSHTSSISTSFDGPTFVAEISGRIKLY